MNLVGIWKVKEALAFDEDGGKWLPVQECMDREDMDDETKSFLSARFVFEPDGLFKIVMAIPDGVPQEKIDQAAAAGEIRLFDIPGRRKTESIITIPESRVKCWGNRFLPGWKSRKRRMGSSGWPIAL